MNGGEAFEGADEVCEGGFLHEGWRGWRCENLNGNGVLVFADHYLLCFTKEE